MPFSRAPLPATVRAASLELPSDELFTVFRYFHGCGRSTLVPEAVHRPQLDGALCLDLRSRYRLKHITVTLEGTSSLEIPYVRKGVLRRRRLARTVKYSTVTSATEKIVWQEVGPLPARVHVFAFRIGLPNGIPPTFYGQHGCVSYILRATITPRGPLSKPFSVWRPVYVRRCLVHPPDLPMTARYSGALAGGTIKYEIEVPKVFACTGGQVKAVVKLEQANQAPAADIPKVRVRRLECTLREVSKYKGMYQNESIACFPKGRNSRQVSCLERLSTCRVRRDLTGHEWDNASSTVQLYVGASNAQPDINCRTLEVTHAVRLKVIVEHDGEAADAHARRQSKSECGSNGKVTSVHRVEVPIIGFSSPPNLAFHYAPWILLANSAVERLTAQMQETPAAPPVCTSLRHSDMSSSATSQQPSTHQPGAQGGSVASIASAASVTVDHECRTLPRSSNDSVSAPAAALEREDTLAVGKNKLPSSALRQSALALQQIVVVGAHQQPQASRLDGGSGPGELILKTISVTPPKDSPLSFEDETTSFLDDYPEHRRAKPRTISVACSDDDNISMAAENTRQVCGDCDPNIPRRANQAAAEKFDASGEGDCHCVGPGISRPETAGCLQASTFSQPTYS